MPNESRQEILSYYKKIFVFLLCFGIFHVVSNLVVYSVAGPEHFYASEFMVGTIWGGLYKALNTSIIAFLILGILIVLAYIDWKNVTEFTLEEQDYSEKTKIILIGSIIIFCFFSLPWILCKVGIYISDVPLLNLIFLGQQSYEGHPSVHLGDHHGFGGWYFVTIVWVLVYTRLIDKIQKPQVKKFIIFGLSFLYYYGMIQVLEDGFNEQLAKRGMVIGIYLYLAFNFLYQIYILIPSAALFGLCVLLIWNKYYNEL